MAICPCLKKTVGLALLALAFLTVFYLIFAPNPDQGRREEGFAWSHLSIKHGPDTFLSYEVEVATTPGQHQKGLMFRESVPEGTGMLFLFDKPQMASFWMKNTLIPLDMLFIRPDGSIAKIVPQTKPQDETSISSGEPVKAVLELAGGESERQGIAVGDKVISGSVFGQR